MISVEYPVVGIHCAACAANIEKAVRSVQGVQAANVNLPTARLQIVWESSCEEQQARRAVRAAGYDLIIAETEEEQARFQEQTERRERKRLTTDLISAWIGLTVLMLLMWLPIFHPHSPGMMWLMWCITLLVYAVPGRRYIISALKQMRHGMLSMDSLIFVSSTVAIGFATYQMWSSSSHSHHSLHIYMDAPTMIIAFVLLGKWLELRAVGRTRSAIRSLIALKPQFAIRIQEGLRDERIPVDEVQIGDLLRIAAGSEISVDGEVVNGQSTANEQMITGESIPNEKTCGSKVYAGTVNAGRGELIVQAKSVGRDTVLGHIIRSVREAEGSKAPIQRLADRIAGIFVPIVFGISILTFACWWLIGGAAQLNMALTSMISVIVIACPCALGLATPTAISVAIGRAAREHILIRSAQALEHLALCDTFVFDKTGTLTIGQPIIQREQWRKEGLNTSLLYSLLYAAEIRSSHPLATTIANALSPRLNNQRDELPKLEAYTNEAGKGVSFIYDSILYRVGSRPFVAELMTGDLPDATVDTASEVLFASENGFIAAFDIIDIIPPSTIQAITELRKRGKCIVLLSGDRPAEASRTGKEIGADKAIGGLMPADKLRYLEDLQALGANCVMVGDGINDSEALSHASVSVAMGEGSDIAKEAASIILMKQDLRLLVKAYDLSVRTLRIIRQNLLWSLGYNLVTISLAAGLLFALHGIILNPGIAAAAMALSSVFVAANSLRLRS